MNQGDLKKNEKKSLFCQPFLKYARLESVRRKNILQVR